MITAQELRKGNILLSEITKNSFFVNARDLVNIDMDNSVASGIPLSPDVLIKAGFEWENDKKTHMVLSIEKDPNYFCFYFRENTIDSFQICPIDMPEMVGIYNIKYLHTLQNLIYALTNTELTIQL